MRAVAITPHTSFSNLLQTSNKDGVSTTVNIAAANLVKGLQYLILYTASYGSRANGHKVGARVEYGPTVIGRSLDKRAGGEKGVLREVSSLCGFYILTGDGVSDLEIKFSRKRGTSHISNAGLVAIPLSNLISDTDFFFAQQNGDGAEVSTTINYTSLIEQTFKLPEKGNYIVFMSAEGFIQSRGRSSDGEGFRFFVDNSQFKPDAGKQWNSDKASRCCTYVKEHYLPAGLRTFRIDVGSIQGNSCKSFRRGRIIVLKASTFAQSNSANISSPQVNTSSSPAYSSLLSQNYMPNRQEEILVITNSWISHGKVGQPIFQRIQNSTDSKVLDTSTDKPSLSNDKAMLTNFASEQINSAKTYELQVSGEVGGSSWRYADIIVMSLTSTPVDTLLRPYSDGSSQGAWTIIGGASSNANVLDVDDSAATYVWLSGAIVGDFIDIKLDSVYGEVDTQITDSAVLEFRVRSLVAAKVCELNVEIYEGDPAISGVLFDGARYTLSESVFELITFSFNWATMRANISDFDNLYIRVSVSGVTGTGDAPDPAISWISLSLPGKTSKFVVQPTVVAPIPGKIYTIYTNDWTRHRKVLHDVDGEGWLDRSGSSVESTGTWVAYYEEKEI